MPPRLVLDDKVVHLYMSLGRAIQGLAKKTEAGSAKALYAKYPHLISDSVVSRWATGESRPEIQGIADWAQALGFDNILGLLKAAGWGGDADKKSAKPAWLSALETDDRIDEETLDLMVGAYNLGSKKPVKTTSRRHRKN